jgi:peptidoglycan-N-acetylglucosamine deacetylase
MLTESRTKFNIPDGTIALTYDDGPGGHTIDIAKFLAEMQVRATFFLIGRLIELHSGSVEELIDLGHGVGNHTFNHLHLTAVAPDRGNFVREVAATDRLIAKHVGNGPFLLRPPYGEWSPQIARALNASSDTAKYVGPILWDVDERDWQIGRWSWGRKWTQERCQHAYLAQIKKLKKGVMLFHSCCGTAEASAKTLQSNRHRFELTRWLVPCLKSEGFVFRPLNELL